MSVTTFENMNDDENRPDVGRPTGEIVVFPMETSAIPEQVLIDLCLEPHVPQEIGDDSTLIERAAAGMTGGGGTYWCMGTKNELIPVHCIERYDRKYHTNSNGNWELSLQFKTGTFSKGDYRTFEFKTEKERDSRLIDLLEWLSK